MHIFLARRAVLPILFCALFVAGSGKAQDFASSFGARIKGKQFVLRSLSADRVARYHWVNGALTVDPPKVFTLALFTPETVKAKGSTVEITGSRSTLSVDLQSVVRSISLPSPMRLEIDFGTTDPASATTELQTALFTTDIDIGVSLIPEQLRGQFKRKTPDEGYTGQQPFQYLDQGTWKSIRRDSAKISEPRLLHYEKPDRIRESYSSSGEVIIAFTVNVDGRIESPFIVHSLGPGPDESATAALMRYKFAPATLNDAPVATLIDLRTAFKKY